MEICDDTNDYDNSWIDNFEILEKDYSSFYKESVDSVKLYFIYINHNNEIDIINQENLILYGKIEKEKIYQIIKEKKCNNDINYKLIGLLKYNISLEPYHIKYFLEDKLDIDVYESFLTPLYKIDDIVFEDTITLFKDLNSLYFIFYDNFNDNVNDNVNANSNRVEPKIHVKSSNPTKKVKFNLKPKKTKKR